MRFLLVVLASLLFGCASSSGDRLSESANLLAKYSDNPVQVDGLVRDNYPLLHEMSGLPFLFDGLVLIEDEATRNYWGKKRFLQTYNNVYEVYSVLIDKQSMDIYSVSGDVDLEMKNRLRYETSLLLSKDSSPKVLRLTYLTSDKGRGILVLQDAQSGAFHGFKEMLGVKTYKNSSYWVTD